MICCCQVCVCVYLTYWIWITQYNRNTLLVFVFNYIQKPALPGSVPCPPPLLCNWIRNRRKEKENPVMSLLLTAHRSSYLAMHERKQPDVDTMWHNFPLTAPVWSSITQTADSPSGPSVLPSCDTIVFPVWNLILMERLATAGCSGRLAISALDWLNTIGSRFSNCSVLNCGQKSVSASGRKICDALVAAVALR